MDVRSVGSSHTIPEFEVSVFDASMAPVERVATEAGGIVLMVDTSSRTPILRRTYEIDIEIGYGTRASYPDEQSELDNAFCELRASLLYAELAPDLSNAIRTAPPFVQDVTAITSGASEVMPAH